MAPIRPATVLSFLLFVAFSCFLVSVISAPIVKQIALAADSNIKFGVFGYCTQSGVCTGVTLGYNIDSLSKPQDFTLPPNVRLKLTNLLIIHPIGALLVFVLLILTIVSHFYGPGHSPGYLLFVLIFSIFTSIVAIMAFLIDILLFAPHLAIGSYIMIGAPICLAIVVIGLCARRRRVVGKEEQRKRIAESAVTNHHADSIETEPSRSFFTVQPVEDNSTVGGNSTVGDGSPTTKMPKLSTFEVEKSKNSEPNICETREIISGDSRNQPAERNLHRAPTERSQGGYGQAQVSSFSQGVGPTFPESHPNSLRDLPPRKPPNRNHWPPPGSNRGFRAPPNLPGYGQPNYVPGPRRHQGPPLDASSRSNNYDLYMQNPAPRFRNPIQKPFDGHFQDGSTPSPRVRGYPPANNLGPHVTLPSQNYRSRHEQASLAKYPRDIDYSEGSQEDSTGFSLTPRPHQENPSTLVNVNRIVSSLSEDGENYTPPRSGWQQRTGDTLVTGNSSLSLTSHNTAAYVERPSGTPYNPKKSMTDYYEDVDPSFADNSQAIRPVLDSTQTSVMPEYSTGVYSTIPPQSLQPDAVNDVRPRVNPYIDHTTNWSRPGNGSYQYIPYDPSRLAHVGQASIDPKSSKQPTPSITADHSISE